MAGKTTKSNSTTSKANKRYESTAKGTTIVGKMSTRQLQALNKRK